MVVDGMGVLMDSNHFGQAHLVPITPFHRVANRRLVKPDCPVFAAIAPQHLDRIWVVPPFGVKIGAGLLFPHLAGAQFQVEAEKVQDFRHR